MKARQQNSTARPILIFMVDADDHVTGLTGLTLTVTLSKDGGSFGAAAGSVSEVGNGLYALAGNATDRNTLGELAVHATATGADPFDRIIDIVTYDPFQFADEDNRMNVGKWLGEAVTKDANNLPNVSVKAVDAVVLKALAASDALVRSGYASVIYLSPDGDDGNDGLTPSTPKESVVATIEAASAGTLAYLLPGDYDLGVDRINAPNGVSVHGAGIGVTRIISQVGLSGSPRGCILRGSNATVRGLTIIGNADAGTFQGCIGANSNINPSLTQDAFNNLIVEDCEFIADTDGLYVSHATSCSAIFRRCIFRTQFHTVAVRFAGEHNFDFIDCRFVAKGPTGITGSAGQDAGIVQVFSGPTGTLRFFNCTGRAQDGKNGEIDGPTFGIRITDAADATVEWYGGEIAVSDDDGGTLTIANANTGTIRLVGVKFDPAIGVTSSNGGTVTIDGHDVTVEARLTAARAEYLNKLDVTGTLAHTDNASTFKATGFSTHSAADVATALGTSGNLDTQLAAIYDEANSASNTAAGIANALPANFNLFDINESGHVARVVLVDTTTTNTDMRGTDNAITSLSGVSTLDAEGVRTAVGLSAANLDTQLSSIGGAILGIAGELPANFAELLISESGVAQSALSNDALTALVAAIEAEIADDATGEAVKQAIIDKLIENLPDLDDLTLAAIADATKTKLEEAGGHLAEILADTGTTIPATLSSLATTSQLNTVASGLANAATMGTRFLGMIELDGEAYRLTEAALENAPAAASVELDEEDIQNIAAAVAGAIPIVFRR